MDDIFPKISTACYNNVPSPIWQTLGEHHDRNFVKAVKKHYNTIIGQILSAFYKHNAILNFV